MGVFVGRARRKKSNKKSHAKQTASKGREVEVTGRVGRGWWRFITGVVIFVAAVVSILAALSQQHWITYPLFVLANPLEYKDRPNFTVGIACLEHDRERVGGRAINAALTESPSTTAVDLEQVPREVMLRGGNSRQAIDNGHAYARKLLKETGCDVLVWGEVIDHKLRLFWTTNRLRASAGLPFFLDRDYSLPPLLESEVSLVLQSLVVLRMIDVGSGSLSASEVQRSLDKTESFLAREKSFKPETKQFLQFVVAQTQLAIGLSTGSRPMISKAVAGLQFLMAQTQQGASFRADVQLDLAIGLSLLGETNGDTKALGDALAAFEQALGGNTPLNRRVKASLLNSYGATTTILANLDLTKASLPLLARADALLAEAIHLTTGVDSLQSLYFVATCNQASVRTLTGRASGRKEPVLSAVGLLESLGSSPDPIEQSEKDLVFGVALFQLGTFDHDTKSLRDSVVRLRAALSVLSDDGFAYRRAQANACLGPALSALWLQTKDAHLFCDALAANLDAWSWFRSRPHQDRFAYFACLIPEVSLYMHEPDFRTCEIRNKLLLDQFIAEYRNTYPPLR